MVTSYGWIKGGTAWDNLIVSFLYGEVWPLSRVPIGGSNHAPDGTLAEQKQKGDTPNRERDTAVSAQNAHEMVGQLMGAGLTLCTSSRVSSDRLTSTRWFILDVRSSVFGLLHTTAEHKSIEACVKEAYYGLRERGLVGGGQQ